MGVVTVEHGNTGRTIAERRANEWRDRRAALMKLYMVSLAHVPAAAARCILL